MGANNIFLIGANSGIARSCLDIWAPRGVRAYLVGRDPERLRETVQRFESMGGQLAGSETIDLIREAEPEAVVARGFAALGQVDCFYLASGILPDQHLLEQSPAKIEKVLRVNFTIPAQLLMLAANRLEDQGNGCIAALASIAGDIGRRSNYVYGSSKSGLSAIMQGLDGRFAGTQLRALDIRPGPVKTPMTAHIRPGPFYAEPDAIARRIVRAIDRGKRGRLYAPAYFRCVMSFMRHLPTALSRRVDF